MGRKEAPGKFAFQGFYFALFVDMVNAPFTRFSGATMRLAEVSGVFSKGAKGEAVEAIQEALTATGIELRIDGDFGTATEAAVRRFQAVQGIGVDGVVGPATLGHLLKVSQGVPASPALPSVKSIAPWLTQMRAMSGIKEIPGAKSNPLILGWVKELSNRYPDLKPNINWYVNDDTPWCGLAVAEAVGMCDPGYKPPLAPLRALNWAEAWGDSVALERPVLGAVMVFQRAGGGHVSLYEGEDSSTYHVRGGNQSNMVNVTRVEKGRLVGIRWPKLAPFPTSAGPIAKDGGGAISDNEA